jgi:hypothetical protein
MKMVCVAKKLIIETCEIIEDWVEDNCKSTRKVSIFIFYFSSAQPYGEKVFSFKFPSTIAFGFRNCCCGVFNRIIINNLIIYARNNCIHFSIFVDSWIYCFPFIG